MHFYFKYVLKTFRERSSHANRNTRIYNKVDICRSYWRLSYRNYTVDELRMFRKAEERFSDEETGSNALPNLLFPSFSHISISHIRELNISRRFCLKKIYYK